MTAGSPVPGDRTEWAHGARPAHAEPSSQAVYLRSAVIPAAVIAVLCVAAAAVTLAEHASAGTAHAVLVGVTCGAVVMAAVAFLAAGAAGRRVDASLRESRAIAQRGQAEVQQMVDRLMRGEQPTPLVPVPARAPDGDPFGLLAGDIEQAHYQAAQGVLRIADKVFSGRADQRVEIFVNLARRMQSLVHREIQLLDDLEAQVEDPELLKGLFTVDHLATRLRRQSESLAVLGGSSSRRQWTRQVTMHEVLRAAVAEVEQYSRVKVVPPVEGVLRGAAVTDVIHLIAELVENATKFSAPHTITLLRAQHVAAGVAIEVEDRGLGMLPADQQRMNDLLADPTRMDVDELLRDGRIGLYVVGILARRHNIRVRLQNNIYGGTQAVVVLPKAMLDLSDRALANGEGAGAALPAGPPAGQNDPGPRLALVPTGGAPGAVPRAVTGGGPGSEYAQPALPTRRPVAGAPGASSAPPWEADSGLASRPMGSFAGGSGMGGAAGGSGMGSAAGGPGPGGRPPLPKRQGNPGAAPQPPDARAEFGGAPPGRHGSEPSSGHMSGLMADFLRGVRSAEEEDPTTRD